MYALLILGLIIAGIYFGIGWLTNLGIALLIIGGIFIFLVLAFVVVLFIFGIKSGHFD